MKTQLPDAHLEAWRNLYVSFWRIISAVETELAAKKLPSLSWYDVLYRLYEAPERRLRMCDLASGAMLSKSGLTRLVDRLEKEKLLERQASPDDGRSFHAVLTERGVEVLRKIWPVYRAGIAAHFAAHLTNAQAREMAAALGRIRTAMEPGGTAPA